MVGSKTAQIWGLLGNSDSWLMKEMHLQILLGLVFTPGLARNQLPNFIL